MKKLLFIFVLSTLVTCFFLGGIGIVSAKEKESDSKKKKSDTDEFTLEEITVTANRLESVASKTPISVTAVLGETMTQEGYSDILDLNNLIPSVSLIRASANGIQATIRGITSTDMTEKGDTSVAFMLDDVYISRPNLQEGNFYDISRVEVLRGPQGTLYGRNTTAGVINVIANKPSQFFEVAMNATYGNYNTILGDGMINLPVNEKMALRASFSYQRQDSFLITPYIDDDPARDNFSARLQYLIDFTDKVSLLLKGDYSSIKSQGGSGTPGIIYDLSDPYNPVAIKYLYDTTTDPYHPVYLGGFSSEELRTDQDGIGGTLPHYSDNSTWGISGDLKWDLGPVALTYLGSYRKMDLDNLMSLNNIAASEDVYPNATPMIFTSDQWQTQHEIRLATTGDGPFKGQMGAYYFHENSGIAFLLYELSGPYFPWDTYGFTQDPTINDSLAFYGQGTYSITDSLRFTAGLRNSRDEKSRKGYTVMWMGEEYDPTNPLDIQYLNDASKTYKKTTWRLGLDYDLNEQTMLYGFAATGYKAGGFNDGCEEDNPDCNLVFENDVLYYDPETITTYEVGAKTRISGKLGFSVATFYSVFKNMQLSAVVPLYSDGEETGYAQVTTNAAEAISKGIEIEGTFMPTSRNRITVSGTWLNAEFDDYTASDSTGTYTEDWSGKSLDRSPEYMVNLGYAYRYPLSNGASLEASAHYQWSDSYVISAYATPAQFEVPSYHKTDLGLTYTAKDGVWYVKAFVKNIEDTITFNYVGASGISTGDPRTYGIRTGFRY